MPVNTPDDLDKFKFISLSSITIHFFTYVFLSNEFYLSSMNQSNQEKNSTQEVGQVGIFLYRAPKKNHDALVKINKHSHEFFMKHGVLKFEVFTINSRNDMMEFTNLSKTMSASEDEDIWLEIQSYRDAEHVKEFMKSMEGDKSGDEMYNEFIKLITPGSIVTFGDFSKLKGIA